MLVINQDIELCSLTRGVVVSLCFTRVLDWCNIDFVAFVVFHNGCQYIFVRVRCFRCALQTCAERCIIGGVVYPVFCNGVQYTYIHIYMLCAHVYVYMCVRFSFRCARCVLYMLSGNDVIYSLLSLC